MWLCVLCYIFYLYHIHILFVMTIHFSNNSGTGKWPLKGDKPLTWTRDPIIEPWLWEEEYNCILVGGFNPFEKYACQIGTLELPPPSIRLQSQCPLVDPNRFFWWRFGFIHPRWLFGISEASTGPFQPAHWPLTLLIFVEIQGSVFHQHHPGNQPQTVDQLLLVHRDSIRRPSLTDYQPPSSPNNPLPSWKLTYPLFWGTFESMIFLFPSICEFPGG